MRGENGAVVTGAAIGETAETITADTVDPAIVAGTAVGAAGDRDVVRPVPPSARLLPQSSRMKSSPEPPFIVSASVVAQSLERLS